MIENDDTSFRTDEINKTVISLMRHRYEAATEALITFNFRDT